MGFPRMRGVQLLVGFHALIVTTAKLAMQYQTGPHGGYVALLCSSGKPQYCQLNAHVVFMVAPENFANLVDVGAEYQIDNSGTWMPLSTDYEYMMWNASTPFITTGRASRQYKGMLLANVNSTDKPAKFCARMWARDVNTGDVARLENECFDITVVTVEVPQTPHLHGMINHGVAMYHCDNYDNCLFCSHMIISTYATDPTNTVFGGGAMKIDDGEWTTKGVRVLFQSKPTLSKGGLLGPRVQIAYESRGMPKDSVPKQICFRMWVTDATTGETSDVMENDEGEPLPAPVKLGEFCYTSAVVTDHKMPAMSV